MHDDYGGELYSPIIEEIFMKMKIAREIEKMSKCCRWLLVLVMIMNTGEMWGSVTVEGTAPGTATVNGNTFYYVFHSNTVISMSTGTSSAVSRTNNLPAYQLYIEMRSESATGFIGIGKQDQRVNIQCSENGNNYSNISEVNFGKNASNVWNYYGAYTTNITRNTKYIRIDNEGLGTKTKQFRNVYLTMASYCEAPTVTYDFGSNIYKVTTDISTIRINWSNIASSAIQISGTNADQFEVIDQTTLGSSAGKCGYTIVTVRYKRTAIGNHTATLKVNGQPMSITLKGTTTKATAIVECPSASEVVSQSAISGSALSGGGAKHPTLGESISGSWSWENGSLAADCNKTYKAIFTPTSAADKAGYNEISCNVSVPVSRIDQTITWNDAEGVLSGDKTFTASAGSGVSVYFTSSDESVAVMAGSTIQWKRSGEVTITAHADADCNYNAAEPVSKTFRMSQDIPTVVNVSATGISFGQTLSESTITGVVKSGTETLSGTWSWIYPSLQPEVGTAIQQVMFTPNNATYASVTAEVSVTVGKLTPEITYISARLWRGRSTYSNPFRSTNQEAGFSSVTFTREDGSALPDPDLLKWDEATQSIVVGYVYKDDGAGNELWNYENNYKVRVCQPETEHFEAYCAEFVNPARRKSDVCLPVNNNMDSEIYSKMRIDGESTGWSDNEGEFSDSYLGVTAKYNVWRGISIGTWRDGWHIIGNDGRSVVLYFTGVPDKISFSTKAEAARALIGAITDNIINNRWSIEESADGTNWEWVQEKTADGVQISSSTKYQLNPDTRYIRITYYGNFAGYILADDFKITRRHGYEVKNNSGEWVAATEATLPAFGVDGGEGDIRPLQVPQRFPIRYFSIGDCGETDSKITVKTISGEDYFYADVEEIGHTEIHHSVDFDQWGEDELTLRNTGINVNGVIRLTGSGADEDMLDINVSAAKPDIWPTKHHLFHTGTEQYQHTETDSYRGMMEHDLTLCFDRSGVPLFDSIYIFGVTGNTERVSEKFDYYDTYKGYWLPKVHTPTETVPCNAHTPLFVYKKADGRYTWERTVKNVSATGLQGMHANDKKLAFIGYCPYAYNGVDETQDGFIYFTGDGTHSTEITLFGTEIGARPHTVAGTTAEEGYVNNHQTELHEGDNGVSGNGALFAFRKTSNNGLPYNVNFHIWGANTLRSTRGTNVNVRYGNQTLQMHQSSAPISVNTSSTDSCVNITINDMYDGVHTVESSLTLISSEKTGVIDIGNEKSTLTVNGGIVNMINGNKPESPLAISYQRTLLEDENGRVAILYGSGTDQTDAHVNLNDGTMMAEEEIRMPWNTVVTGGTYLKDINCYEKLKTGSEAAIIGRPTDGEGREVNRVAEGMFQSELPAGYGHESVVADEQAKVYPLLPGERRENSVNPWVAAMPENEAEAAVRNSNLLYMEVADGLFDSSDRYKTVVSSADYSIDGKMSMLIQVDRADRWRTMVAPFDVKRVYVLELAQEEGLKYKKDRAELIARNKAAAEDLHDYLKPYVAPSAGGSATLLPLRALLSKYMAEHENTGEGISPIKHYDGTNYNEANYYLYQVKEPSLWEIEDAQAKAQWDYVTAKADGTEVIMQQGHTYSMSFTYCPTCDDEYHESRYDYWTGKLILLEGDGGQLQSASGAETALENSKNRADATHVVLTGNSSLGSVSTTGVYRFNPLTDKYEKASGEVVLSPTESVMYASGSLRAAAIHRSGRIEYAEGGSDSGNEGGITTETDSMHADEVDSVQKVMQNGTIYIIREGNTYTVTGQRVK